VDKLAAYMCGLTGVDKEAGWDDIKKWMTEHNMNAEDIQKWMSDNKGLTGAGIGALTGAGAGYAADKGIGGVLLGALAGAGLGGATGSALGYDPEQDPGSKVPPKLGLVAMGDQLGYIGNRLLWPAKVAADHPWGAVAGLAGTNALRKLSLAADADKPGRGALSKAIIEFYKNREENMRILMRDKKWNWLHTIQSQPFGGSGGPGYGYGYNLFGLPGTGLEKLYKWQAGLNAPGWAKSLRNKRVIGRLLKTMNKYRRTF